MRAASALAVGIVVLVLLGLVGAFFLIHPTNTSEKNLVKVSSEKNVRLPSVSTTGVNKATSTTQTHVEGTGKSAKGPILWSLKLPGFWFINKVLSGDVDGDGKDEIIFRAGRTVGLIDDDGTLLWERNFEGMAIGMTLNIVDVNGSTYVAVGDVSGLHFLSPKTGEEVSSIKGVRYPEVAFFKGDLFLYSDGNLYRYSNGRLEFVDRVKGVFTQFKALSNEYLVLYSADRLLVYEPSRCEFRGTLNPPANPFVATFRFREKNYIAVLASKELLSAPSLLLLDPSTCNVEENLYTSSRITDAKVADGYLVLFTFDPQGYHALLWNGEGETGEKTFPFYVADVLYDDGLCFVGVRGGSLFWSGECGSGSAKIGSDLLYLGAADVNGDGKKEVIVWDKENKVLSAVKIP